MFLSLVPSTSRAEPAAPERPPPRRWYGYETLATDGVALAVLAMSRPSLSHGSSFGYEVAPATTVFLLGAPTVHLLERRPAAALGSLLMRAATVLVTSSLYAAAESRHDYGAFTLAFLSMGSAITGSAAAVAVDAAATSRYPPPQRP